MTYLQKGNQDVLAEVRIRVGSTIAILLMSAIGLIVIPSISTIPEAYAAADKFGVEMVYPKKQAVSNG